MRISICDRMIRDRESISDVALASRLPRGADVWWRVRGIV